MMKPRLSAQFSVVPSLDNVALFLVRDGWLDDVSLISLGEVDVEYELLVSLVPTFMTVDFQSIRTPRLDYASQDIIPPHRIKQMASCAIHYSLDFGLVARFLGG